jgi:hypothetical protein
MRGIEGTTGPTPRGSLRAAIVLARADRALHYGGGAHGYTDYPTYDERGVA